MAMTWASARRPVGAALVAGALLGLAGCGGGGGGSEASASTTAAKAPAGCDAAPFEIQLGAGADAAPAPFAVADAAAQRVAVLPGKMAFDASEMAGLSSQAAVSPLGQYTIYVTDDEIDVAQLKEADDAPVAAPSATVAAVRILPAGDGGFLEGEVVAPSSKLTYETRSAQVPVQAAILPGGSATPLELTDDLTGTVTVLEVGDEDICVDVDLTIAGAQGGRIQGTVLAPVTRAGTSFFVT